MLIVVGVMGAAVLLRLIVTGPLVALGRDARQVTQGDFDTPLAVVRGAREIVHARDDVEAMREIIVGELATVTQARARLQEQALELDAYPGTGIGLAMCRKIMEYHGGRIWLDTDYLGGTRLRLTLPISEEI